jgi:hypothetical protein
MPNSLVSKTPTSLPLTDGSYCALFNDFSNGYTAYYCLDRQRTVVYTKLDMSTYKKQRCLHYQIYHDKFSDNPDAVLAVPYIKDESAYDENEGFLISEPLFECISPMSTYIDDHGSANVLFWTNLKPSEYFEINAENGQYKYDSSKILKINHDEINNFSFEKNTITRILCSVTIEFRQLYIKTEISDGLIEAPMSLVPVAKDLVIIKQVKADSPVLDFSYGGGGETTKTSNSRHAHTNNSDCGFAFAVFHPGTGVPLGNPWKN